MNLKLFIQRIVNRRYHFVDSEVGTRIQDLYKEERKISLIRYENIFFKLIGTCQNSFGKLV